MRAPWLHLPEKKRYRARVFKSGNSLAVRIPAGTELAAGMEMDLVVEDGVFLSLEPVKHPKRKFNIAKVAGSAQNLGSSGTKTVYSMSGLCSGKSWPGLSPKSMANRTSEVSSRQQRNHRFGDERG